MKTDLQKAKRVYYDMVRRCHNPKSPRYKYYGERGIKVCKKWKDNFDQFLKDIGTPPIGKSIGRKNNNKGYSKSNCRWETRSEQMRNTRRCKKVIAYKNGVEVGVFDSPIVASEVLKVNRFSILHLVNKTGEKKRKTAGGYTFKTQVVAN